MESVVDSFDGLWVAFKAKSISFKLRHLIHNVWGLWKHMKKPPALEAGAARAEGGCDLTRGTRGKEHPQSAFKVAHLAAGGNFLCCI